MVITTYTIAANETPFEISESDDEHMDEEKYAIFHTPWYRYVYHHLSQLLTRRIILDEAHKIKNKDTKISKAMAKLRAKYRWCLTGTPVHNSIADLFGLIRFLDISVRLLFRTAS